MVAGLGALGLACKRIQLHLTLGPMQRPCLHWVFLSKDRLWNQVRSFQVSCLASAPATIPAPPFCKTLDQTQPLRPALFAACPIGSWRLRPKNHLHEIPAQG